MSALRWETLLLWLGFLNGVAANPRKLAAMSPRRASRSKWAGEGAARKVAPFRCAEWASSMRFRIISGTAIQEFVERCGSAADALGRVRVLLKAGLPNIRVLDEAGRTYSFTEIEELADDEADSL